MNSITKNRIIGWLNIFVLFGSLAIVANLSYDILTIGVYNPDSDLLRTIQLWVCGAFLVDFWVRFSLDDRKTHFFFRNILLLIFSIPYLNIVHHLQLSLTHEQHYLLGLIPLLRGGYGLLVIIRWIAGRTVTTLVVAYLMALVAIVYFSSMLFFVAERGVNVGIDTYYDALWWAFMDMSTVGSNIIAVTPIGKILSVVLAFGGMMMLPIFTVYITDLVTRKYTQKKDTETQH